MSVPSQAKAAIRRRSKRTSDVRSASALTLAGIAALLSSSCCVMPLVFVVVGISGSWIGQLRRLTPYSPALSALAIASLMLAGWQLYRPAANACGLDGPAGCRWGSAAVRRWFWVVVILTLMPILVPLAAPLFY